MKFISITPDNLNSAEFVEVTNEMPAFVKLYSPGCGFCVSMQKAWDALKNNPELKDYNMAIIEVHADEFSKINSPAMTVNEGLPTIRKILKKGNLGKDYEGNRSSEDMIKFIKENFSETLLNKHKHSSSPSPKKHKTNKRKTNMRGGKSKKAKKSKKSKKSKKARRKTKKNRN